MNACAHSCQIVCSRINRAESGMLELWHIYWPWRTATTFTHCWQFKKAEMKNLLMVPVLDMSPIFNMLWPWHCSFQNAVIHIFILYKTLESAIFNIQGPMFSLCYFQHVWIVVLSFINALIHSSFILHTACEWKHSEYIIQGLCFVSICVLF